MLPQEHRGDSLAFKEPQSEVVSQTRFRFIADGPNQMPSLTPTKDAHLLIEEVWWNSEQIPNLCYQIENAGLTASSRYSLEIYRGSLEKANIILKTALRSPLKAGQNIVACMAVPAIVRRDRESILLVAKEMP